jgi:hypothetical protein
MSAPLWHSPPVERIITRLESLATDLQEAANAADLVGITRLTRAIEAETMNLEGELLAEDAGRES